MDAERKLVLAMEKPRLLSLKLNLLIAIITTTYNNPDSMKPHPGRTSVNARQLTTAFTAVISQSGEIKKGGNTICLIQQMRGDHEFHNSNNYLVAAATA